MIPHLVPALNNLRRNAPQEDQESASKSKRQWLNKKFEWEDETVETLIMLWGNQPVQYNVSNPYYDEKKARRNDIMRIIDEIKKRGIFPSPSFDDVLRKK